MPLNRRPSIGSIEIVGGRPYTRHLEAGRTLSSREVVRFALGCLGRRSRELHAGWFEALDG